MTYDPKKADIEEERIVRVTKNGSDTDSDGSIDDTFLTIKGALGWITSNLAPSDSDPVAVKIGTGYYTEDNSGGPITIPDGVHIVSYAESTVFVSGTDTTNYLFTYDTNGNGSLNDVNIYNMDGTGGGGLLINTTTNTVINDVNYVNCTTGMEVRSSGSLVVISSASVKNCATGYDLTGSSQLDILQVQIRQDTQSGTGVALNDANGSILVTESKIDNHTHCIEGNAGGDIYCVSMSCQNSDTGIYFNGDGLTVFNDNTRYKNNTTDFEYVNNTGFTYNHKFSGMRYTRATNIYGSDVTINLNGIAYDSGANLARVEGNMDIGDTRAGNYIDIDETTGLTAYGTARGKKSIKTYAYNMYSYAGTYNGLTTDATSLVVSDDVLFQQFQDSPNPSSAILTQQLPVDYQNGTDITVDIHWTSSATSGDVVWGVGIFSVSEGDAYLETHNFNTVTSTSPSSSYQRVDATVTFSGSVISTISDDDLKMVLYRNPDSGADTMTDNALMSVISIQYITNKLGGPL